jgi:predicted GNAT family N-acyltransferase
MRKQGVGSEVMQQLSEFADQQGKTIALSPSTDFGASSVSRLKDFYKRFGFIENKGRNKDFSISESMYRLPSQPSRKEIIEQELKKVVE